MAAGQVAHRGTWRSVDRFIALTPFMSDELVRLGIEPARIVLRATAVPDPGPPPALGTNVLFVGRLDEMKGPQILFDAWRTASPPGGSRLRIVGDGPLLGELRRRAAGEDTIDVLGALAAADVAREMRAAAVVAIPSLWYEGQPRVLAEAFAHGRPVLATDLGGLADLEGAGWSVRACADSLATALAVLHDRRSLRAASSQARRRYERRHSLDTALGSLLKIYTQLSDRPTREDDGHRSGAPPRRAEPRRIPGRAAGTPEGGRDPQRPRSGPVREVARVLPGAHQLHL
jgi:glycosyltransferase involved in cell wall biosynthesis